MTKFAFYTPCNDCEDKYHTDKPCGVCAFANLIQSADEISKQLDDLLGFIETLKQEAEVGE